MLRLRFFVLALLPLLLLSCEEDQSEVYTSEFLEAAAPAPDGGYVLAGRGVRTDGDQEDADGYLVRLNANGGTLWEHRYDLGPFGGIQAVRVQADGSILAAGIYRPLGGSPMFLLQAAADGSFNWLRAPAVGGFTYPTATRPTADGGFLWAGMTQSGLGQLRLIKCDADANITLDRTYNELANLTCSDAVETADGNIVLLCRLISSNRLYLIKTGTNGDTLWTRPLGTVNSVNIEDVLAELPSGDLVVATANDPASAGYGPYDLVLYRANAAGEIDTATSHVLIDTQVPFAVAGLADDGVILAGLTRPETATAQDFLIVRTAANGAATFTHTYNIAADDRATFVLPGTDGGFLFGGYTSASGRAGFDGCALKIDGNGTLQWQRLFGL